MVLCIFILVTTPVDHTQMEFKFHCGVEQISMDTAVKTQITEVKTLGTLEKLIVF